ncbi:MAG: DUF1840 domain-containing protein [Proteobacteria bacterium]|nr:DUF1840 domain-containing protein [Pseudomonadota bacterium]
MLYKFKSQVAAEVIMLQPSAEELLKLIGKAPGAQGIITAAQAPAAIAALQAAIQQREAQGQGQAASVENGKEEEQSRAVDEPISLRQRAAPFIDLLERSTAAGKDVVWGV